jgi:hypothetical protein
MVLVRIVTRRRDDEIGRAVPRREFERFLHLVPRGGQPPVRQIVQFNSEIGARQESLGRAACLLLAVFRTRQDDVPCPQARVVLRQAE